MTFAIETTDGENQINNVTREYPTKQDAEIAYSAAIATDLFYGVSFLVDGVCTHFYANGGHYGMFDN